MANEQREPPERELIIRNEAGDIIAQDRTRPQREDRKSTRLNSSHSQISYAVFCLKKKKKKKYTQENVINKEINYNIQEYTIEREEINESASIHDDGSLHIKSLFNISSLLLLLHSE